MENKNIITIECGVGVEDLTPESKKILARAIAARSQDFESLYFSCDLDGLQARIARRNGEIIVEVGVQDFDGDSWITPVIDRQLDRLDEYERRLDDYNRDLITETVRDTFEGQYWRTSKKRYLGENAGLPKIREALVDLAIWYIYTSAEMLEAMTEAAYNMACDLRAI